MVTSRLIWISVPLLLYLLIVGFVPGRKAPPPIAPPMAPPADPGRVAAIMLSWHSLALVSITKMQTLWAGYGHICAIVARATSSEAAARLDELLGVQSGPERDTYRFILKLIAPPHAEAGRQDEGHLRKMLSYEVEQYFYSHVVPQLDDSVAVAKCLASTLDMAGKPLAGDLQGLIATVITDLRPQFPVAGEKRAELNERQVHAALEWLARFHASSWRWLPGDLSTYVRPPLEEAKRRSHAMLDEAHLGSNLWLCGGYTYLATRRKEYASLVEDTDSEWSMALCRPWADSPLSIAEMAADFLKPRGRPFETYIHGDVKSENLFTTASGGRVAFFDFQYVGLGLGVSDLAKFFTSSVPLEMLTDLDQPLPQELPLGNGEKQLLEEYRTILLQRSEHQQVTYGWDDFVRHWETALVDWLRFQASWGFWGNTEWLEARVRYILSNKSWIDWLQQNINT